MYRIFLVEDDEKIRTILKQFLQKYGYDVVTATDYSCIKEEVRSAEPHVVLLDINLPRYDGFYWCRQIRTISNVPIVFISARAGEMDQVMAIENGGDDYITKPFHFEVVLAKIKSVLRRTYGEYAGHAATTRDVYDVGGLYLLRGEHAMEWDGKRLELSKKEFLLLDCLAQRVNSYVPRDTLLETLWDAIDFVDDNTLSVNVARVRKKLAQLGAHHAIETKRGAGYRLVYSGGSSE